VSQQRTQIMDDMAMNRSITRMAHEILERNKGLNDLAVLGIQTRGKYLAQRISAKLTEIEGVPVYTNALDARPFRDDVHRDLNAASSHFMESTMDFQDKIVILVDDVLFTGRTVRAALDAIMYCGRARQIQLAVLIDRGHRELPIRPDYVGKNVPTASEEQIGVDMAEVDGHNGVWIVRRDS